MMKRVSLCVLFLVSVNAWSQIIFYNDFEEAAISPLFPLVNDEFVLPDEPAANQLNWVVQQLSESSTSLADINTHFSSDFNATSMQSFLDTLRTDFPNGKITDIVGMTPMSVSVVVEGQNANEGFFSLNARYTG